MSPQQTEHFGLHGLLEHAAGAAAVHAYAVAVQDLDDYHAAGAAGAAAAVHAYAVAVQDLEDYHAAGAAGAAAAVHAYAVAVQDLEDYHAADAAAIQDLLPASLGRGFP